jgi:hypothetical protein
MLLIERIACALAGVRADSPDFPPTELAAKQGALLDISLRI